MSRQPKRGAVYGSPEHGARIGAGLRRFHALRAEQSRIRLRDVDALEKSGTVPDRLRPLLGTANFEAAQLIEARGGPDFVTPQERFAIEDYARLGVVMRAEFGRFVQDGDPDAGSRVGTLAGIRRSILALIGLDRVARDVGDLGTYLAAKRVSEPVAATPEPDQGASE